jgi:hypothetical protein
MRTPLLGLVATTSLLGASLFAGGASAAQPQLISGVYLSGDAPALQPAQFFFGGQTYCWYQGGWQGPGYYLCGYAWREGLGWGGGAGWNGWHRGHGGSHYGFSSSQAVHAGGYQPAHRNPGAAGGNPGGGGRHAGSHAGGNPAGGAHGGGAPHRR